MVERQTYIFEHPNFGTLSIEAKAPAKSIPSFPKPTFPLVLRWGDVLSKKDELPVFFEWQELEISFQAPENQIERAPFTLFVNRRSIKVSSAKQKHALFSSFCFENAVGLARILVKDRKGDEIVSLETEVFPQKLDYQKDYHAMMQDIIRIVYNLAYDFFKDTFQRTRLRDTGQSPLSEYLSILQVLFEQVDRSLEVIRRQPKHEISQMERVRSVHRVKRLAPRYRKWIRSNAKYLSQEPNTGIALLPNRWASHLPEMRKQVHFDTFENRFVVWAIRRLIRRTKEVYHILRNKYPQAKGDHQQLESFLSRLQQRLHQTPFNEVSPFEHRLKFSTTLTMAAGYKDFYHRFLTLQRGLSLQQNGLFQMEVKDIATIYEYWCFLKMVELLRNKEEYEMVSQDLVQLKNGRFLVHLQQGQESRMKFRQLSTGESFTLYYNRKFKKDLKKIFTYDQKPDMTLSFEKEGYSKPFWYVFDAKYRFTEEKTQEGKIKYHAPQDAIGQLHRYRDAILHSEPAGKITYRRAIKSLGGIILYPYPGEESDFKQNPYYQSIQSVNIGALPFLPSKTRLFENFLDQLLICPPESHYEQFLDLDRADYERYFGAFDEVLVLGLVPNENQASRLSFLEKELIYHIPVSDNRELDIFRAQWLAIYEGGRRQVTGYYRIQEREMWSAEQLRAAGANWSLSSDTYLIYHLKEVAKLGLSVSLSFPLGYRYTNPGAFQVFRQTGDKQSLNLNGFNAIRLYREMRSRGMKFTTRREEVQRKAQKGGSSWGLTIFEWANGKKLRIPAPDPPGCFRGFAGEKVEFEELIRQVSVLV